MSTPVPEESPSALNARRGGGESESQFSSFVLAGKIVIKAQLGDDIRIIPIHNDCLTYDELILMMIRIFKDIAKPEDFETLVVKYKDAEFSFNDIESVNRLQISGLRSELVSIRGQVDSLISRIDSLPLWRSSGGASTPSTSERGNDADFRKESKAVSSQTKTSAFKPIDPLPKELDPLATSMNGPTRSDSESVPARGDVPADSSSAVDLRSSAMMKQERPPSHPSIPEFNSMSIASSFPSAVNPEISQAQAPAQRMAPAPAAPATTTPAQFRGLGQYPVASSQNNVTQLSYPQATSEGSWPGPPQPAYPGSFADRPPASQQQPTYMGGADPSQQQRPPMTYAPVSQGAPSSWGPPVASSAPSAMHHPGPPPQQMQTPGGGYGGQPPHAQTPPTTSANPPPPPQQQQHVSSYRALGPGGHRLMNPYSVGYARGSSPAPGMPPGAPSMAPVPPHHQGGYQPQPGAHPPVSIFQPQS
ncbi:unnamed protein product [Cyprideis torosa]|uniref:Uncharacterized protein n=1 Tax=Cyprideis torosa TaxID=163714 RepID=A0A7R8ZIU2_9CRUS|nr:unnamed protein product [Cyprideis torosa]CAG0885446.1 unnamed protein product [Cyprideis torosa]